MKQKPKPKSHTIYNFGKKYFESGSFKGDAQIREEIDPMPEIINIDNWKYPDLAAKIFRTFKEPRLRYRWL